MQGLLNTVEREKGLKCTRLLRTVEREKGLKCTRLLNTVERELAVSGKGSEHSHGKGLEKGRQNAPKPEVPLLCPHTELPLCLPRRPSLTENHLQYGLLNHVACEVPVMTAATRQDKQRMQLQTPGISRGHKKLLTVSLLAGASTQAAKAFQVQLCQLGSHLHWPCWPSTLPVSQGVHHRADSCPAAGMPEKAPMKSDCPLCLPGADHRRCAAPLARAPAEAFEMLPSVVSSTPAAPAKAHHRRSFGQAAGRSSVPLASQAAQLQIGPAP